MPRVLVVGLDGGTWTIFDSLLDSGHMPNLARLIARGCRGILKSTVPPITPVAWTTFQTGVPPEHHGVFGFYNVGIERGRLRFIPTNSTTIKTKTLWEYAGECGRRVAILSCPMTYPPYPVRGVMLPGFPAPSSHTTRTYPETLEEEVARLGIRWVVPASRTDVLPRLTFASHHEWSVAMAYLCDALRERVALGMTILQNHSWDLAFFQFQELDWVQHAFWPQLAGVLAAGDWHATPLVSVFAVIDEGLGRLLQLVNDEDYVTVLSDHGFQGCRREVYPNRWLAQRGLLRTRGGVLRLLRTALLATRGAIDPHGTLARRIPRGRRAALAGWLNQSGLDEAHSTAYLLSDGSSSTAALYLLDGSAQAWPDLVRTLEAIQDPETGEPVVDTCLALESRTGDGPNLWVCFRDGYAPVSSYDSGPLFRARIPGTDYQLGIHDYNGVLVTAGPGIRAGHGLQSLPTLTDMAPTILHQMRLPVPTYMTGHVLTAAFHPEYLAEHPTSRSSISGMRGNRPEAALSVQDEELIAQRLRDLGYLD